ncbi:MAG: tRNA (adenosine(37)-N6)-threonylcarbamoyltransferase complex dimerization subunit type 1 TsaB [Crocinitomicaceae bacterium]|nr:tRNA (adenosine(37)-N6)-threonylcarbamoyltransferase complex dimerization subunit type 1 TsaB [Crocinitomicaceae bacterium]
MSALILHLETSTKICSVALSENGTLLSYLDKTGDGYIHGEQLTLMITEVLNNTDFQLQDLSAISYSSGPGSYTGLRIGLSTAKGLCFGLQIPLIAIPTHQILFQIAKESGLTTDNEVFALLDARRSEVYLQTFDAQGSTLSELQCALLENTLVKELSSIIVVGDANEKAKTYWTDSSIQWLEQPLCAKFQANPAFKAFEMKAFEDLAYCSPIYLKGANGVLL